VTKNRLPTMKPKLTRRNLIALAAGACASAFLPTLEGLTRSSDRALIQDPEEYVVYSALLNSKFASAKVQQFVINDETSSRTKQPFIGFIGGRVGTGAKRPETESDTMSDFDAKNNDNSCLLERRFDLKVEYILVADEKLHIIFVRDKDGHLDMESWPRFYKLHPGTPGIVVFSRVGFNAKKDQALVYVAIQSGLVGGSGTYFVLAKSNKNWEIQNQIVMWLS
jgi:hypothetical protein